MSLANAAIMYAVDYGIVTVNLAAGTVHNKLGREIGSNPNGSGYRTVTLRLEGNNIHVYLHRIVAYAQWGEKIFGDTVIDHINGDRTDNRIANLRIATSSENAKNRNNAGSPGRLRALNDDQVRECVDLYNAGWTQKQLAKRYHVVIQVIDRVLHERDTYANLDHAPIELRPTEKQSSWTEFWQDVDAGVKPAPLSRKYNLSISTVLRRIERRKA